MEKYSLTLHHTDINRTMYFLYVNDKVDIHQWKKEIYHEYYKINIFIHVNAAVVKGNQKYNIKNTGILYYKPFESHFGMPSYTQTAEYFEFLIPRKFFSFVDGGCILENLCDNAELFSMNTKNYQVLIKLLFALKEKFKNDVSDFFVLSDIINIFEYLKMHQKPINGIPLERNISSQLLALTTYIDNHCYEISSVQAIANQFHMSTSYICRLFREQLLLTPYQYLTEKKLEYAKTLLCNGSSVTEAAIDSGFYGSSVFIQKFKKKYGITPNEYKKLYFSEI